MTIFNLAFMWWATLRMKSISIPGSLPFTSITVGGQIPVERMISQSFSLRGTLFGKNGKWLEEEISKSLVSSVCSIRNEIWSRREGVFMKIFKSIVLGIPDVLKSNVPNFIIFFSLNFLHFAFANGKYEYTSLALSLQSQRIIKCRIFLAHKDEDNCINDLEVKNENIVNYW